MRAWSRARRADGRTVGLVPTMGYLHEGHLSLVRAAHQRADATVASIYVNPTQFAPHEDFDVYPRDEAGDLAKLDAVGCDLAFIPGELYGDTPHRTWVEVAELTAHLCGASRPTFFRGVATVVTKLFHIVEPDLAFFGRKDFQQLRVIEQMVHDLDMPISIVGLPIVREADGLAMSSRNARLGREDRVSARVVPASLDLATDLIRQGARGAAAIRARMASLIEGEGGVVDYASLVDPTTLQPVVHVDGAVLAVVAVSFGNVRLIDNRAIGLQGPAPK